MDITKLKKGQVIKNYKELCTILNEENKTGKSKQLQLKDWERYFTWHKQGQKFIIQKVYSEPKAKIDDRKGNSGKSKGSRKQNNIYSKYIKILILHILAEEYQDNNLKVYISKGKMLNKLNMVNENFRYANYNRNKLANYLKMKEDVVNEFFNLNYQNLNNSIVSSLNSLQNIDNLISYKIITTVVTNNKTRTATNQEEKLIKNTEFEVMEEMGYKNMCPIHLNDLYKEFKSRVIKKLNKNTIIGYYKSYDIVFSDYIQQAKERIDNYLLDDDTLELQKSEINSSVYLKLNKNAENRHVKAKKKCDIIFGTTNDEKIKMRSNKEYVKDNQKIINLCIDEQEDEAIVDIQNAWDRKQEEEESNRNQQLEEIFG